MSEGEEWELEDELQGVVTLEEYQEKEVEEEWRGVSEEMKVAQET